MSKSLVIILIIITAIYFQYWGYKCGEYEGQATQYSYYKAFYELREDKSEYRQLHQFSAGLFNPFCK